MAVKNQILNRTLLKDLTSFIDGFACVDAPLSGMNVHSLVEDYVAEIIFYFENFKLGKSSPLPEQWIKFVSEVVLNPILSLNTLHDFCSLIERSQFFPDIEGQITLAAWKNPLPPMGLPKEEESYPKNDKEMMQWALNHALKVK